MPTGVRVYQRDASWYARSHGGSGGKYHFEGEDCASACGKARMLDTDPRRNLKFIDAEADTYGKAASMVPRSLRCRAKGCKEKWPDDPQHG